MFSLRVVQYNIGKFNYGRSGGLSEYVNEKIRNYNSFLSVMNPAILGLQEFTEYIDTNEQYDSDISIFNSHFTEKSHVEKETSIKSQYAFSNSAFSYLHTSGDYPAWCVYGNATINDKNVVLISAVLNVASNIEQKLRALNKLVNVIVGSSKNVIICMDTNANSKSEADDMKEYMANNGFYSGNWGKFGYLETYNLNWEGYRCIDNIFVRGAFEIVNFEVPDVYNQLSSDHYPVIADLLMTQ